MPDFHIIIVSITINQHLHINVDLQAGHEAQPEDLFIFDYGVQPA